MVQFPTFEVERWMDEWETKATYNLAETCSDSITLDELLRGAAEEDGQSADFLTLGKKRLTYGAIQGSTELREGVARTYGEKAKVGADEVLITQGAIAANFLALLTLSGGSESSSPATAQRNVICVHPTYQQLYEVPRSLGIEVRLWQLKPEQGWKHDLSALSNLIDSQTRLVILNNPNNPTGQVLTREELDAIVDLVERKAGSDCYILADEVYRPLYHSVSVGVGLERTGTNGSAQMDEVLARARSTPSLIEVCRLKSFHRALSTGSLSKAWSLAGLRIGWVVSLDPTLLRALGSQRDYNCISVSMVDDDLAARALGEGSAKRLMKRNIGLARRNREILERWIEKSGGRIEWTPTVGGTTALLRLGGEEFDDYAFCQELVKSTGVLLVPAGRCFDQRGHVRIGYCGATQELQEGLEKLWPFVHEWDAKLGRGAT